MRSLNLDHLRTFAEVIANGSFSKAAARLGLTQPAVSVQIRNLERRLQVRLIERVGKRAFPTAAGRDLLEVGHRLRAEAEAAIALMEGHQLGRAGRVRIGTGATACIYILPKILASVRSAHPGLEITVVTGNTPDMLDAVEKNALDLALVTLPASRRSLLVREILEDPMMGVFPAAEKLPSEIRPHYFIDKPLILYAPGATIRTVIGDWFAAAGVRVRPTMELGNVEATKRFVAAGLGCSILPHMAVVERQSELRFQARPLIPRLIRKMGIALRHGKALDAAAQATLKAFEQLARLAR